ncbi:RNA polymerase subunit RPABC4/transcription elongation factor Spt4 [Desulfobaculum xiamenense]|uniref:RNA polymerase subunit RPABC4/transcription elongation factor Spt4 n=1 Tax=Desulfobaculum xiamenense TaxID=995050 RepID=A0A846QLU7_9BACT|nr:zinc ribbon domain-containing protein [Desulfobaculum xiamenense]NJB66415.1 RNA polymerase subunit RPABC4/transcription elongation factor Spt4 [Desulfobaculum xiamenense]
MPTFVCMMVICIFAALIAGVKKRHVVGWFFETFVTCCMAILFLGVYGVLVVGLVQLAVLACLPKLSITKIDPVSMVICTNCGANLPTTFKYCPVCEHSMKEVKAKADAVRAREEWEQGRRECPHCAELIKRKAKVCCFCGKAVEPEQYPGSETSQFTFEASAES